MFKLNLFSFAHGHFQNIVIFPLTTSDLFDHVFASASCARGPSSGAGGAFGRLRAWRSLAALCGAKPGDDCEQIGQKVQSCDWFLVCPSNWKESRSLGIGCLRADLRHLAVLAASDLQ